MIAAVATIYNEAEIIDYTVEHLLGEGIDRIYIADASTDDTRAILASYPEVTVIPDDDTYHYQPKWINHLAGLAQADGATWILPFDADEFFYGVNGRPVATNLTDQPSNIVAIAIGVYPHFNWAYREDRTRGHCKIAFRPLPGFSVANGNHHVFGITGDTGYDILAARELQFYSLDHFHRKCRERVDRLDPTLGWGEGTHQREYFAMGETERINEWERMRERATVLDPIPLRFRSSSQRSEPTLSSSTSA